MGIAGRSGGCGDRGGGVEDRGLGEGVASGGKRSGEGTGQGGVLRLLLAGRSGPVVGDPDMKLARVHPFSVLRAMAVCSLQLAKWHARLTGVTLAHRAGSLPPTSPHRPHRRAKERRKNLRRPQKNPDAARPHPDSPSSLFRLPNPHPPPALSQMGGPTDRQISGSPPLGPATRPAGLGSLRPCLSRRAVEATFARARLAASGWRGPGTRGRGGADLEM